MTAPHPSPTEQRVREIVLAELGYAMKPGGILSPNPAMSAPVCTHSAISHPRIPIPSPVLALCALNGLFWFSCPYLFGAPVDGAVAFGLIGAFGAAVMFGAVSK